ncbi:xylan 1,4-beta-xylosidase [Streptomyces sp. ICBB 8177]|uniref:xylan 1,4-beta-xylosidase n=1 Tax=Streptomyces sp. ICBB 8177 TaxID=563922 RepID=UPI001F5406C4|nr:xylan 1,4-beta-xylosidase [Streptomyces sp. ICBB 8177]
MIARHEGPRTGRPGSARRRVLVASAVLAACLLCLGALLAVLGLPGGHGDVEVTHGTPAPGVFGSPGTPGPPSADLGFGFTHTQFSADDGTGAADRTATRAIAAQPLPQDQAIMGWGADNPEPAPGAYDFTNLDSRVALIRATGGTPVLTLCCAPDWMKGGRPGTTDWSKLEQAPDPAHYADFAALAAKVARRYPDVTHFLVWNEFKGFWDESADRWDYQDYTRLYNLVYAAVKKAAPHDLVGGPYLDMDSVAPGQKTDASAVRGPWGSLDQRVVDALDYWLAHKKGADFLVVDGASTTHDGALDPGPFTATGKFAAVGDWLRRVGGGLPVWWAEWYVKPDDASWPAGRLLAVQAAAMMELVEGGAAAAFYWNPETREGDCPGCLWNATGGGPDGGAAQPMLTLLRRFAAAFPPGAPARPVTVAAAGVRALAGRTATVAVNTTGHQLTARVGGTTVTLAAYGVNWLPSGA